MQKKLVPAFSRRGLRIKKEQQEKARKKPNFLIQNDVGNNNVESLDLVRGLFNEFSIAAIGDDTAEIVLVVSPRPLF